VIAQLIRLTRHALMQQLKQYHLSLFTKKLQFHYNSHKSNLIKQVVVLRKIYNISKKILKNSEYVSTLINGYGISIKSSI